MKFSIIKIEAFSGTLAKIYSIKFENNDYTELRSFLFKYDDSHSKILKKAVARIHTISNRVGLHSSFFRRESPPPYNVYRLLETKDLRLYCIILNNIVLLFGSGGQKKFGTIKLAENPVLEAEVIELMKIEDSIKIRISSGSVRITSNGFEGNITDFEI